MKNIISFKKIFLNENKNNKQPIEKKLEPIMNNTAIHCFKTCDGSCDDLICIVVFIDNLAVIKTTGFFFCDKL